MRTMLKRIQDEIIGWWKEQTRLGKTIILLFVIGAIILCFKYPDPARNLILLIAGIIGWYFLNRRTITAEENTKAAEESTQATIKNTEIAEQGLTVERLTRATEQLASDKSSVRLGGILGLVKIFQSHKEEKYRIIRVLAAFIHDFAPIDGDTRTVEDRGKYSDIEEAVQALAFLTEPLPADQKKTLFDLQFTNLSGLGFVGINLSYFNILGVNFSNSHLYGFDFTGARLGMVNFSGVHLVAPKGLTQEQLEQAFYWKGNPPKEFPPELKLTEKYPNEEKKDEDSTKDNSV